MSRELRLRRTRQCAKCPWKVSTNPYEIPSGYDPRLHAALANTIAEPGALDLASPLRVMACHEHPPGQEVICVGWLANQLGHGNNIPLRIHMLGCENLSAIVLDGEQHAFFEDTLPDV